MKLLATVIMSFLCTFLSAQCVRFVPIQYDCITLETTLNRSITNEYITSPNPLSSSSYKPAILFLKNWSPVSMTMSVSSPSVTKLSLDIVSHTDQGKVIVSSNEVMITPTMTQYQFNFPDANIAYLLANQNYVIDLPGDITWLYVPPNQTAELRLMTNSTSGLTNSELYGTLVARESNDITTQWEYSAGSCSLRETNTSSPVSVCLENPSYCDDPMNNGVLVDALSVTPPSANNHAERLAVRRSGTFRLNLTASDQDNPGTALADGTIIPIEIKDEDDQILASFGLVVGNDLSTNLAFDVDDNWVNNFVPYLASNNVMTGQSLLDGTFNIRLNKVDWALAQGYAYNDGQMVGNQWESGATNLTWTNGTLSGTMGKMVDLFSSKCYVRNSSAAHYLGYEYDDLLPEPSSIMPLATFFATSQGTDYPLISKTLDNSTILANRAFLNTNAAGLENVNSGLDSIHLLFENGMTCTHWSRGDSYIGSGIMIYNINIESQFSDNVTLETHVSRGTVGEIVTAEVNGSILQTTHTTTSQGIAMPPLNNMVIGERYLVRINNGTEAVSEYQYEINYAF